MDVGAGRVRRYKNFFSVPEYLTVDTDPNFKSDFLASADALPFEDNSLDSILSTQVLEHVKNPVLVLKEFFRVLKPGGKCLITIPQWNELHEEPNDFFRYTKYGIRQMLLQAGFDILFVEQRGGYYSNLAQMNIRYLIDRLGIMKGWAGFFWGPSTWLYGRFMIWLDSIDKSAANRRHAIGWLAVAKK